MNNIIHIIQHTARAATLLLLALLTAQTAGAEEGDLTDFVAVSSQGTATARFVYSDHFYRVDWSGINTDKTSSVQLFISSYNDIRYKINGNSGTDNLYASATQSDKWRPSHITSLTPGQSSDGYTNFGNLATGASSTTNPPVYKKVCTITCLSANAPTWNWSADYTTCTATFTCTDDASLTATVEATVTAAGGSITASATFNGSAYSDTKPDLWGRSDGRDGTTDHPYAIGSPEALALLSTYVNAGNNASGLNFVQTQDIDMSSAGNFTPIGYDNPFNGIYDGKGHAITGLTVNTTSRNAALFGYMEGGSIRNVTMVNPSLTCSFSGSGDKRAGGIVGSIRPGTIMNCNVINPTLSAGYKGAICGTINGGGWCEVRDCYYYTTGSVGAVGLNPLNQTVTGGRIYTLTLASGVTTSTAPAFTYGGTGYYAGTITLAAAPTGWTYAYSVNGSAIGGNTFDISADATVAVTRTPITYTITYNLGGGTNAGGNPATYTIQSPAITLSAPTRTGYTFGGWYANSGLTGNQVTTIGGGSTGNVELWAKWTPTQYTITYNLGGGTNHGGNPSTYTVESAAIALGAATRTGYTFGGWYRNADLSGDAVTTIATGTTGDVELWAKWTANTYAVAFDGNGATDGEMADEAFDYDEAKALTACAYTRTGYHFTGWNTEADGSGTAYTDGQEVENITAEHNATMTLYAQWTANTYTVHFNPVIPVYGTMADMTLTYDQPATALTKNVFYTTTGQWLRWNTEADGSGTDYEDEALVQNLTAEDGGVVTLYAQWRLAHRFIYDNTIFRCSKVDTPNEVYRAYEGEKVKVEVIDPSSEYTIRVVNGDGEDITLDTDNTFVMPNEEVWITYTSVKRMSYTTISLDNFESWENVAYLYDANQPTVTPTVVVKDGENELTEGTDYTVEITNNTGSATQMVTATVTVTGMGGYVGTNTQEFRITPFNIANCEIKGTLEAYDDGYGPYYPLERNVQVWNGETQLTLETDYTIELDPNIGPYDYVVGEQYQATIKGKGDWGGSQTFQFKVVELHHTVVFVANGGSGTMASDVATKGQHYILPPCGFTAPDGKKFSHWVASCEPDAEKQPGKYFTAPYIWNESDVQTITVTAYWRDKATCTVTLPEEMEVVSGTLTDGKAIEDEVITFRPRPGFTATDVQANGTALTPDGEGIYTLTVTADVTVTVGALAPIDWATVNQGDSEEDPYMIYNKDQLLLLAHRVNGTNGETANDYLGKYFKLGADITFSHAAVEGDNYDENYEAIGGKIGGTDRYFKGNFDGDGHTVSGIRIRKTDSGTADIYQGLFGRITSGANIYDVHLTDARITGYQNVGGIAGENDESYIMRCTVTDSYITATGNANYGTICGRNNYTYRLTNNYYHGCTVNGTAATSGVGCKEADIATNNGALPAYRLDLGDGVTIQTTMAADLGFTCDADNDGTAENYWRSGVVLTLGYTGTAPDGYIVSGYTATNGTVGGNANDGYTLTMPAQDVTITTAKTPDPAHFSVNDAGTEYTILTAGGWNVFCDLLADNAKGYFSGKTVRLGADITVTRMAGGSNHAFTGTFDGGGHTLTLDYGTADEPVNEEFVAPFVEVTGGAKFTNLNIGGHIYAAYTGTDDPGVGGLIGHLFGGITIEDCTSTVTVNSTKDRVGGFVGLCEHAVTFTNCKSSASVTCTGSGSGFVGWSRASKDPYTIAFEGCLFDGKVLKKNDVGSGNGGFVGWTGSTKTVSIQNSLVALDGVGSMASGNSTTFARGWDGTFDNSFYTAAFGTAQGKQAHTVTAGDNVTIDGIALTGDATQYTVSGITAYSGGGLQLGQTLYYGSGDALSLTLSNSATGAPQGYQYGYTASAGTLSGTTLTMPDADVTISVNTAALASTGQSHDITYIDADGSTQTAQAIALDGTEQSLDAGTYFAGLPTVQFDHKLTLTGNVTLILCDGCEMKVGESGSEVDGYGIICYDKANNTYYDLTICGQTAQTGTLSVYTTGPNNYAIGTHNITVNGGNVIAHTDGSGHGIDTKRSGNVTINRGSVSATTTSTDSFAWAISAAGNLTINGGNVSAKSNSHAIQADGNVAINGGTVNAIGGDGGFSGIYSNGTIEINGGNVTASSIYSDGTAITLGWTRPDDRITASSISTYEGGTVAVANGKKLHNGSSFLGGTLSDPATAVNGKTLRPAANTTYTTADGNTATADAILLDTGDNSLPAGNYLATGTLNYTHGITLTGNVTLILADNCQMNVGTSSARIESSGIISTNGSTLTVTSQSLGNDMGALDIYNTGGYNIAICASAITINGGNVTADTDGYRSFALWTQNGDLTINGGTVSATTTGSSADAITVYGDFYYNGGNVTATAPKAYAIRAVNSNYTFSWRTPGDRITIGATGLYAPAAKTATFTRLFTDADSNYYGATLTGTALNALKGVTLEAAETADFTVTLAPKGYGTYYDGHYDITLPAGTQARIVTARGGTDGTLDYETIADGDDGITLPKTVPAGTAVMLCHDGGGSVTLTVNDADIDDRDFTKASGNTPSLLHGSDVATETTGGTLYYKLTYGSATGHESIFGWYWGAADGAAFESPAHKAWLALPAAEARSFIGLPEDETTGVTPLLSPEGDENGASPRGGLEGVAYYTLDGRKLDGTPMKSGIYVNNGKKVIIK